MNEFNIATNTQIGKIEIPHKVYPHENSYQIQGYTRSGEFIENMVTDNMIEFFKRWFNLGGIQEVLNDIDEYYSEYSLGKYRDMVNDLLCPIIPVEKTFNNIPVTFGNDKDNYQVPVYFNNPRDKDTLSYNNILQGRNYSR